VKIGESAIIELGVSRIGDSMVHEKILDIGVIVFILFVMVSMAHYIKAWQTSSAVRDFLKNSEGNVNATLVELRHTLQNLRKITYDIGTATEEVRQMADSLATVEKDTLYLYQYAKSKLAETAQANLAGLKAGVKTGITTLVRTLKERRGDKYEGRID